jgi:DAK2 domain fusion protein YloV
MAAEKHLNGTGFTELIRAGHARLKQLVDVVNALNIFPVPDGDTGTNMELSLASGVSSLDKLSHPTLASATQTLASGLLMGARGNSGVILSQLFRGFSKAAQNAQELDVATFAQALHEGVQIAYRAVAKPVEGTILTVAREAAAAGLREAKNKLSLSDWMHSVYQAAAKALAKTPDQLLVLKQAGVVDSGGQGLVFIFEGFERWLKGEPVLSDVSDTLAVPLTAKVNLDFAAAHIHHEGEFGYCTEVLVRLEETQVADAESFLRQTLSSYGDSLLVVGAEDLVKVHVHTLNPGRVLEDALRFGALVKIKIENMTEQHAEIQAHSGTMQPAPMSSSRPHKDMSVVAVSAGDGLRDVFTSLGVDVVLSGGQTMNPSTEEIVEAVKSANSDTVIVLPNNKNIVMAAEQAKHVLGDMVHVVPTTSIPEGISAMMAYIGTMAPEENARRMTAAMQGVRYGQVVRAVRDSVYQDREIKANQYLGFANQQLIYVGEERMSAMLEVVKLLDGANAELLTVFYGAEVPEVEVQQLNEQVGQSFGLELDVQYGGQPIYDYIFSLE